MRDQRVELATLNLSGVAVGIISSIDDVRNYNFLALGLSRMPIPLQTRIARDYVARYNRGNSKAQINANVWLRRTTEKLKPRFGALFSITQNMPLPWHILSNKDKTKKHAEKVAIECIGIFNDLSDQVIGECYEDDVRHVYEKLGQYCQAMTVSLDYWESREKETVEALEIALKKVQCEKWWARKLKTVRTRYLELLEIATGQVGKDIYRSKNKKEIKRKGISPYSSKQAQCEFIESQRSGREFLGKMELESDSGTVIDLVTAVDAGMANPINRRNELMLRMRETEELATEMGYVGIFYTLTCPSKYHPNSDKWIGSSPKDSQAYLVKTWSRTRTKLKRLGLGYFGIRVVEPHADGCPHWHMMLFMPKNKVQWINAIIRKYFIFEDREELLNRYGPVFIKHKQKLIFEPNPNGLGVRVRNIEMGVQARSNSEKTILFQAYKKQRQKWGYKKSQGIKAKEPEKFYRTFSPRFTAILMDSTKGSAAGYIAKYISKNIDGYQVTDHEDDETGENITVNPVLCWANTWGIRQFQFQGSPSVTVYRELRKVREPIEQLDLERVRQAADVGSWINFVKEMGGMCIGRLANFRTAYEVTPFGNAYGEAIRRVKGVATFACPIAQAVRELRGVYSVSSDASLLTRVTQWVKQLKGTAAAMAEEAAFVGAADQSWTSGNNCTPLGAAAREARKLFSLGLGNYQVNELKKGKRIRVDDRILSIEGQKLIILEDENQIDLQKRNEIDHWAHIFARTEGRNRPFEADWQKSREMVATAFVKANNEGRAMPIGSDWVYAREIADGEAEADWWDAGLMQA
ncbi:replication protein [Gammaproteobacteria bacterium 42_54_T18]|nr:replication protein [Gammaproteobacteria bacterium 42_54_T18]